MVMSSNRPYLIRALYEWIVDNDCTPHILVNAFADGAMVPQNYVGSDGQIVLNISPSAVFDLIMNESSLSFRARFGGVPTDIYVPYHAVLGIYAKENQQGMIFEPEPDPDPETPLPNSKHSKSRSTNTRPSLKVVK